MKDARNSYSSLLSDELTYEIIINFDNLLSQGVPIKNTIKIIYESDQYSNSGR